MTTNTGTGGFPIDGKLYNYDVGATTGDEPPANWSAGDIKVEGDGADLSKGTKRTLASYLSRTTLGQTPSAPKPLPNVYPISHPDPGQSPTVLTLTTEDGHTSPFTDLVDQPQFKKQLGSTYTDAAAAIAGNFIRGKQVPAAGATVDGNALLQTAAPEVGGVPLPGFVSTTTLDPNKPIKAYTDAVLEPNTYGNENTYTVEGQVKDLTQEEKQNLASYLSDTTFGQTESASSQVSNPYPVLHIPGTDPSTLSLQTEKGYVPPFTELVDQPQFKKQLGSTYTEAAATLSNEFTRGRQEPAPGASTDGNYLLPAAAPQVGQGLPPPGAVNTTQLSTDSPVKSYTDAALGSNEYGSENPYTDAQVSVPLRPAAAVGTTPYNGLGYKDIPEGDKSRSRTYVAVKTADGQDPMVTGNRYPLDLTPVVDGKLSESGKPAFPLNTNKFVEGAAIDNSRSTAATPDRLGKFFRGKSKSSTLNETDGEYDGNTLLRDATDDIRNGRVINPSAIGGELPPITTKTLTSDNPINRYYGDSNNVSNSVIYNRFSGDLKFEAYSDVGTPTQALTRPHFAAKYPMGKSLAPGDQSRNVTFGKLAQVGNVLSLRSGRELGSLDPRASGTDGTAQANALLPGVGQLGVERTPRSELEAGPIISDLPPEIVEEVLIDPMSLSWGSLTNVQDQFSGISNFGMQLLAVALFVAFAVVIAAISLLLTLLGGGLTPGLNAGGQKSALTQDDIGRHPFGAYEDDKFGIDYSSFGGIISTALSGKGFSFYRAIGFTSTRFDLFKCIPTGAALFFGIKIPSNPPTAAGLTISALKDGPLAVAQSPGYYAIVARNVSRSFLQIADGFAGIKSAFATGITSGIKQIFESIDIFRNSKFIASLNIFARLGDRYLLEDSRKTKIDEVSKGSGVRFITTIDEQKNSAINRSRLNVDASPGIRAITLAWASYRAPDMFIAPSSLIEAAKAPESKSMGMPSMSPSIKHVNKNTNEAGLRNNLYYSSKEGRIPTDLRERMEDSLEAEYVPFYLHDMRTNEILSFHAFLASLDDSYSASFDSADGFGRVEPIRTYKGTQRKISFSFYLVSTSPEDFNSMWLKINKLTTMVYPQFTEGRTVIDSSGKNAFYAPFSQTIQAGPMVRVRIGDVIKSNYSRFNLARIFGYSYPGTSFNGSFSPSSDELNGSSIDPRIVAEATKKIYVVGNTFRTSSKMSRPLANTGSTAISLADTKSNLYDTNLNLPAGFVLKIVSVNEAEGTADCLVEEAKGNDRERKDEGADTKKYSGGGGPRNNIAGFTYRFNVNELETTITSYNKLLKMIGDMTNQQKQDSAQYALQANGFMSDDVKINGGNAVARSFRSAGGKGLAGVIESLSFNWLDRTTWEFESSPGIVGLGRRAPRFCLINVSFSPIHDITPGLDHLGANRAPIYPVGSHAFDDMQHGLDSLPKT